MQTYLKPRWLLVFSLIAASVAAIGVSAQEGKPPHAFLSTRSDLVVLPATVVDTKGRPIAGLDQAAFSVYENDVLQPVTFFTRDDTPVTVGLVIDDSGSMRSKRADVIAAGLAFARSSNPSDELFTLNFNEHVWAGLPAGVPFTDRPEQLQLALSTMTTDGLTALHDATIASLDHLRSGTCTRKVLIVISDGGDNASQHSLAMVIDQARRSDVVIYAVGLVDDENRESDKGVLKELAKMTGGVAFFPGQASEVPHVLERIAREIRAGYTIGYIPTADSRDGTFRRVRVVATSPDHQRLVVRTRAGYQSER